MIIRRKIKTDDIEDYQITTPKIATSAITTEKISDYAVTDVKIATSAVKTEKIADYAVTSPKIATGAIVSEKIKYQELSLTAIPDVDTEYAHDLGVVPKIVSIVPQTTGVLGYVMESARSATSITLRASVSGVDAKVYLFA